MWSRRGQVIQALTLSVTLLAVACGPLASDNPLVQPSATEVAPTAIVPTAPPVVPTTAAILPVATENTAVTPAEVTDAPDFAPLVATIEAEMATQQVPGLAVGVLHNGEMLFSQGFGVADLATNTPVTPSTSFRIGSITKPLTTIGLMQLVEAGQVDLDQPVVSYVPEFIVNDQITVRQLLSHSSGLGDAAIPYGRTDVAALQDYVASLVPASAFAPPGTLFSYSNPGFNTVGRIIETVSGMPYADYMTTKVFPALGMTQTTFARDVAMANGLALGYYPGRNAPEVVDRDPDNGAEYPSGFAFSTVGDLARVALLLLNDGSLDGQPVLQPEIIQAMKTPTIRVEPLEMGYGLGLLIRTQVGETVIGHNGNINGYSASLELISSHELAVIVLANRNNFETTRITQAAFELFLGSIEPPPAAAFELDETTLASYAGRYVMSSALPEQPSEVVTVAVQEGGLTASLPDVTFELRPVAADLFDLYAPGVAEPLTRLAFVRDELGAIQYMSFTMHALIRME
jgi:CubicO group peptidase (beta-lactamase class C family)